MVSIAVIQNQNQSIFDIVQKLMATTASDATSKYGVVALQFLLHSKTEAQWQINSKDPQTPQLLKLLMAMAIDSHKESS